MAEVTVSIPDAWVDEDDVLYIPPARPSRLIDHACALGNAALVDAGHPPLLNAGVYFRFRRVLWVEPSAVAQEHWSVTSVSKDRREGWVRIVTFDITALIEEATLTTNHEARGARGIPTEGA